MDTHFLPIQYELRDLMRQGDFEGAHRALSEWAAENADDAVLSTRALRFRAQIFMVQQGPIPEVGQLYRDVWRASRSLGPGEQAAAINDMLYYAHSVGDVELGNQGRLEYARLLERHGEDPAVRDVKSRLCLGLGWLSHVQGDLSTAKTWFSNAAVAGAGDDEDDRQIRTMAWSLAALECARLSLHSEAKKCLVLARKPLAPGMHATGYYYWVHAEASLALGRIFEAEEYVDEAAQVQVLSELKILVPCTRARIQAALGHEVERDRYLLEAEAQVTPHTALYLRQEIGAVRPKPT